MKRILEFFQAMKRIAEFFQESKDGCLSMTRLTIFIMTLAYIVQSSFIAYQSKIIPDMPVQVAGMLVLLYGLNRSNINIGPKPGA